MYSDLLLCPCFYTTIAFTVIGSSSHILTVSRAENDGRRIILIQKTLVVAKAALIVAEIAHHMVVGDENAWSDASSTLLMMKTVSKGSGEDDLSSVPAMLLWGMDQSTSS